MSATGFRQRISPGSNPRAFSFFCFGLSCPNPSQQEICCPWGLFYGKGWGQIFVPLPSLRHALSALSHRARCRRSKVVWSFPFPVSTRCPCVSWAQIPEGHANNPASRAQRGTRLSVISNNGSHSLLCKTNSPIRQASCQAGQRSGLRGGSERGWRVPPAQQPRENLLAFSS